MKKQLTILFLTLAVIANSTPSHAGWDPIRDIKNGVNKVRTVVDSGYRKKQENKAKNQARQKIIVERDQQLAALDKSIAQLLAEIKSLEPAQGLSMTVMMKKTELDFLKSTRQHIANEFNRQLSNV